MINSDNLCMSCMKEIGDLKQCPHCGFHADSPQIAPYLPIRTVLGNRYLVGKLLEYNGDGATYMGLDLSTRTSVNIREFFPEGLAVRDQKTLAVSAPEEYATLFNECLHSFVEMWRKLMRLSGLSALIKVQDVLEGNGTCYAVTENIEGLTLREYLLRNNVGYISWEKARPLLMPVLSTLGTLHSSGIVHRGISPSTLVVANDGKIRITGFSISQVRSARSELNTQLYNGYAAFEQYGFDGRQGAWTDIYGFGAVLYRTLIGTDPIDATERVTNDRLMVPGKFAEQLPAYVINGLVNALQILPEDRTRSVEELRAELSASPSAAAGASHELEHTAKQPKYQTMAQRIDDEEDNYTSEKREAAQKRHNRSSAVIAVASIIIVLAVAFLVLWQTGVIDLGGMGTTAPVQQEVISVPNFVGKSYTDILDDPYYSRNFKFEKSEVYSSTVEEGIVISQSASVDSQVEKNSVIKLTVSKGKEIVTFPTSGIIGTKYEDAANLLKRMGFTVYQTEKLNNESQVAGTVAGISLEAGGQYEKGTVVYLFVWGEPETTTTEPTEPTDGNGGNFWDDWFNQNGQPEDPQAPGNGY
ncbi:MAG: PASTA domain-containing protein [Clostridia bacterium]|nr:PASTA domain-containing protein [Clostridia bacterium]